jgi:hypothetical protein
LVRQEFYGLLMAHFAVRGLMHEAALIAELTRALWFAGGAGLVIGGLAGWFLGRRTKPSQR